MSDDFMDLLSGEEDDQPRGQEEKGVEDLLGGLLGGGGGGGGLGALLGGLMGGGGAPSGSAGGAEDLLGSLLGGGGAQGSDTGDMAGMLGSLLGGGGAPAQPASGSGGLEGLLGGLLGGGGNAGQMSFGGGGGASLPFAGTLAKKLGISEQMASMLIMGAIGLLTSSMAKNRGGRSVDVNSLADPDYIRSSGVSSRLSEQMGISEDEAILGLQQTMGLMVAGDKPAAQPKNPATKKTTAKKAKPATEKAAKKPSKTTRTTPKKKATHKEESGSDFMDLLDDPNH
ncbi:MAG: hypothetical protein KA586_07185 [Candidatus Promineofilum sp.]|nr:hypothetical protein [Promineifilum sp.]